MHRSTGRKLILGVMAKYWASGQVKTRLGATIGMPQAADVHRAFCQHLATQLAAVAEERSFVITPRDRQADFAALLPEGWGIRFQGEGELGCRMKAWFMQATESDVDAVLIGADCPLLEAAVVDRAGELLGEHDVVLGPAIDGGYYLIGLRGPWRNVYQGLMEQMPWSSDSVFDLTCLRAEQAGLRVATLPPMEDVDTITELQHLVNQLKQCGGETRYPSLYRTVEQAVSQRGMA
ncbi:TIGR04282 family arsenosugar biosynthesis glycosyltransferase [Stieleria sp. ICT_E10.1]|uniref:TIGR04282 family arsenosugar biosynthesis glycosyltransferase n=1 Tax=Stieleria sedimenti TaxID=2976331 RepID=UPI0021806834|nr:TIGR04282 family arsenosugar biosynthesis glycosyltransferase [Stieleria sedimenti]MCS7467065.1 TIGR04282 family arsenosugar biosynthesis glycosyltransferase [Stieleria sedimenti]